MKRGLGWYNEKGKRVGADPEHPADPIQARVSTLQKKPESQAGCGSG